MESTFYLYEKTLTISAAQTNLKLLKNLRVIWLKVIWFLRRFWEGREKNTHQRRGLSKRLDNFKEL